MEQFCSKQLFTIEGLNDFKYRGQSIFFQEAIRFIPRLLQKLDASLRYPRAFQSQRIFVEALIGTYHRGFNFG